MCNRMEIDLYTYNIELQRPHGNVYTGIDRAEYEDVTRYIRFKMYARCFENMERRHTGTNVHFKRFAVRIPFLPTFILKNCFKSTFFFGDKQEKRNFHDAFYAR